MPATHGNFRKLLFTIPQLFKGWIELPPDNSLSMHWITQARTHLIKRPAESDQIRQDKNNQRKGDE